MNVCRNQVRYRSASSALSPTEALAAFTVPDDLEIETVLTDEDEPKARVFPDRFVDDSSR